MPGSFSQIYPNQAIAICTREQAAQLGDYDHPIIQVDRRAGVMLTHEWLPVVRTLHSRGHPRNKSNTTRNWQGCEPV